MTIENKLTHIQIYLKKLKFANENCDGMGWDKLSDWNDQLSHTWKVKVKLHLKSKWQFLTIVPFFILSRTRIRTRTRSRSRSRTRTIFVPIFPSMFPLILPPIFPLIFHQLFHLCFQRFPANFSIIFSTRTRTRWTSTSWTGTRWPKTRLTKTRWARSTTGSNMPSALGLV